MLIKNSILALVICATLTTSAISDSSLESKAKNKISSKIDQGVSTLSGKISENITSFAANNFEKMKYLDFEINAQEYLKPTFSIMSVTEIFKIYSDTGTIFNQTSLNTHDDDETINIGFGIRKLLNDNKVLIGSNVFYDHQFDDGHKRAGAGAEAISSIFDLRGNYYNAITQAITTKDGSETALDGWDAQVDYHLPIKYDVNIFLNAFKFESPTAGSTYEETGNKFGANAKLGNFLIEGGYMDDNQENDSYFGSIKYVVALGDKVKKDYYALSEIKDPITDKKMKDSYRTASLKNVKKAFEYTSVEEKLYQPVKRENKIRVVKISSSGFVASGF
jgi:adhesin/invasin